MGDNSVNLTAETEAEVNDDVTIDDKRSSGILKQNATFVLLTVFFLFGLLLGALFIAKADSSILDTLDYLFFSSIETRMQSAFFPIFIASVASSFLFILAEFFCGLSMWGSIIVPIFPLIRGFGLGMTAGYVYSFGWTGIFYYILMILPGAFLSVFTITLSGIEAIRFSKQLNLAHKIRHTSHTFAPQPSVHNYIMRFGLITCLSIIAALVDILTAFLFSGIFQNNLF